MIRTLFALCAVTAAVLLGAAAWLMSTDVTEPGPALTLAESNIDVGTQITSEKAQVPLRVINSSGQSWRIINLAPG